MPHRSVYLDYASSTPVDPRVAAAMADCLTREGTFGNPSSGHAQGRAARARVEQARAQVAALIGARPQEVIWTSCATEANNLALFGVARRHLRIRRLAPSRPPGPPHIVTSRVEHKSVLAPCGQLEREGFSVTYLKPGEDGVVAPSQVLEALRAETILVSLMHVNNETGVITDVAALGRLCRERGIPLHVDAAQSAGRLPIDVRAAGIDLLSMSAHKLYGPKGAGALFVSDNPAAAIEPQMLGGEQERGLRAGTLATHQIVGMGAAAEIAGLEREADAQRLTALKDRLRSGLQRLGGVLCNGAPCATAPHILNVSFEGVHGASLHAGLQELAVSSGSTCNSASAAPSYVLRALGRSDALAQAAVRFSLGRYTTEEEVDFAIQTTSAVVRRLRDLSPAGGAPMGTRDGTDGGTGAFQSGEAGSIERGTWVKFLTRVADERIAEVRFQAHGGPETVAACEWLVRHLPGAALQSALPTAAALSTAIQAPAERLGELLIVEDALRNSLSAVGPVRSTGCR